RILRAERGRAFGRDAAAPVEMSANSDFILTPLFHAPGRGSPNDRATVLKFPLDVQSSATTMEGAETAKLRSPPVELRSKDCQIAYAKRFQLGVLRNRILYEMVIRD